MSHSFYITMDTGGFSPAIVEDVRNVTYNNHRIFREIGFNPTAVNGRMCSSLEALIEDCLKKLNDKREELRPLEPLNGWGGVQDVKDFLETLLQAVKRHPKATVSVY